MEIYDKEDFKFANLHEKFPRLVEPAGIVKFPASLYIAVCGCFVIFVETPFGVHEINRFTCEQHMDRS